MTWFRVRDAGLPLSAGRMARLKAAIKQEANQAATEAEHLRAARVLIRPQDGLPTLKADLIRLAALLHVPVEDKDSVAKLKDKIKSLVSSGDLGKFGSTGDPFTSAEPTASPSTKSSLPMNPQSAAGVHAQPNVLACAAGGHGQEVPDDIFQVMSHVMNIQTHNSLSDGEEPMDTQGWETVGRSRPRWVLDRSKQGA